MASESKGTVLVALASNLGIAVAKLVGGLVSGSTVMLAEAAHSCADTMNQVFLLTALRRGGKQADARHPFGYGKERFFWSLLAAVGIFVAGGVLSIIEGAHGLLAPSHQSSSSYLVSYLVLAVAFVLEGTSLVKAVRQSHEQAQDRERSLWRHIQASTDPTVKTVVSEDAAAIIGLVIAAAGVGLHQLTGVSAWDSWAAIAVGMLLIVVAFLLGRDTKELLIGQAADPEIRLSLYDALTSRPEIDRVVDVMTMLLGPERLLVAVRVDLADDLDGPAVQEFASRLKADLVQDHPQIVAMFVDPAPARGPALERARQLEHAMQRLRRHLVSEPRPPSGPTTSRKRL